MTKAQARARLAELAPAVEEYKALTFAQTLDYLEGEGFIETDGEYPIIVEVMNPEGGPHVFKIGDEVYA